jgi:predicted enzyme related to lactoylglutathione lyase
MHGQFVWYELMTPDLDAARRFYAPITGWGTQPFDQDYMLWTTGGVPFAGLFRLGQEQREQGIPPNWMPYVEANNIDETARLVTSLGGKIVHGPEEIPNVGRFAVVQDPQGATFGIYKSSRPSQSWDGTPVIGRFSWHELMTTDHQKAFDFYRRLFGWDKTGEMDMGGGNSYRMFGKGKPFGGMFTRFGDMASMQPFWLCYINVKDVPKAFEMAKKTGAQVQRPPMDIPGGVIAILGDPQGAAFALHHETRAAAAPRPAVKTARKAASRPKAKAAAKKSRPKAKAAAKKRSSTKKASASKRRPASKKRTGSKKRTTAKKRTPARKQAAAKKRSTGRKRSA